MNAWTLAWRGFQFYWRSQAGVVLGAAIGAAVLAGALLTGASINQTLHEQALSRIGDADYVLSSRERFVRAELASDLEARLENASTAPALQLQASASHPDNDLRVNRVNVNGVDESFWSLHGVENPLAGHEGEIVAINERMARNLNAKIGDTLLVRAEKPSILSRDAPLSTADDQTAPSRLEVVAILSDSEMGRFDLRANQIPPHNAFVPLQWLQDRVELYNQANMILVRDDARPSLSVETLGMTLNETFQIEDAQLSILDLPEQGQVELRTERIFLDDAVVNAAKNLSDDALGVISYLVNILESESGDRTPYSIVSAVGPLHPDKASAPDWAPAEQGTANVNQWLADDLKLSPGDSLELTYFIFGPMRRLVEESQTFTVGAVLPMESPAVDENLMPEFPGLAGQENCRDWDPGFIINLDAIRDKDETYWDDNGGAPKAILALDDGQSLWSNRFGSLTAIRLPVDQVNAEEFRAELNRRLAPTALGLVFMPIRDAALDASGQAMNFSGLFIGLSFFLIIAALILLALLFTFAVEQRGREIGLLLAVGFLPKQVRRMVWLEGALFSLVGGLLGIVLALGYTRAVIWALSSVWSGAVASAEIEFHADPAVLATGLVVSVIASSIAIALALRKQAALPARELLHAGLDAGSSATAVQTKRAWGSLGLGVVCALGAVALGLSVDASQAAQAAGAFFGVGALLLVGGIALMRAFIYRMAGANAGGALSVNRVALCGAGRRPGRSLAAAGLLACGSFLVIAVGANQKNAAQNADLRDSGTGGFAIYAETAIPLVHDLNSQSGLNEFAMTREDVPDIRVVPLRVREGDDASCLNLNRAQSPRLMGVNPSALASRGAFKFASILEGVPEPESPWLLLNHQFDDGAVPAIVDQNSMMWALGKSLGDSLTYVSGSGEEIQVRLIAALNSSILQGSLLLAEDRFLELFPRETGYRAMLIDAPYEQREDYAATLNDFLQDLGIEAMPADERLQAFNQVENTYLRIFLVLGALGLLLGSAGLGVVLLRNMLERRGEFALMRAIGFSKERIERILFVEHAWILAMGLLIGAVAGLSAAAPHLIASESQAPTVAISTIVGLLFVIGSVFTWIAARAALRGSFIDTLRNE